jgi:hypothetical protein
MLLYNADNNTCSADWQKKSMPAFRARETILFPVSFCLTAHDSKSSDPRMNYTTGAVGDGKNRFSLRKGVSKYRKLNSAKPIISNIANAIQIGDMKLLAGNSEW